MDDLIAQRIPAKHHFQPVIELQAIRLDAYGRFQYRIDAPNRPNFLTTDPDAAIDMLSQLGVADGARLLAHVQEWGSVELPTRATASGGETFAPLPASDKPDE